MPKFEIGALRSASVSANVAKDTTEAAELLHAGEPMWPTAVRSRSKSETLSGRQTTPSPSSVTDLTCSLAHLHYFATPI